MWIKPEYWEEPNDRDKSQVEELLGKMPAGEFMIAVRNDSGQAVVIENAPFMRDGTPMPTRYWLVDPELVADVSRLESHGGVKNVQEEINEADIAIVHESHEQLRNEMISESYDGPRPSGGVGGTRRGVKCLHTHVAHYLATGNDIVGQWTLDRIAQANEEERVTMGRRIAVIDVGSNTTRLLVRDTDAPTIDIVRRVTVTGLGRDLDSTGVLSEDPMLQTRTCIEEYVNEARKNDVSLSDIYLFATAAARRAHNGAEFIASLEEDFGIAAEIISGETEGETAFRGAMSDNNVDVPAVVFDIGGASTEFALSSLTSSEECSSVVSIPVGSVVMTNRYIHSDPPLPEELTNTIADVTEHLKEVQSQIPLITRAVSWVGVAATVTTIAAIEIGLPHFSRDVLHGFVLTRDAAEDVFRTIATESRSARIHNPGLEQERADVIVAGCAVVVAIMRHFDLTSIIVSCSDLLDGLWLKAASIQK